jgi:hypothetical protein
MRRRLRRLLVAVAPILVVTTLTIVPATVAAADLISNPHTQDVTAQSAVLAVDIGPVGNAEVYFQYREQGSDTWQSTPDIRPGGPGTLRYEVTDLEPGTTYEFRGVVKNRYEWTHTETFTTTSSGAEDSSDGGSGLIVNAINELKQTIKDQFGGETLGDAIVRAFFGPFLALAKTLLDFIIDLLTTTPDVFPNEAVEDVHRRALIVTYILAAPAFMLAGLLYMTGPLLGIQYAQVRRILPRLIIALVFAAVSLPLLQLGVDLTNALTAAFTPDGQFMSFSQAVGLSAGLVLVWFIQAILLLVVTVAFVIRAVYILFVAAISPLIALAWAIPPSKRYADSFISGWFTALAMAPLDVLVLRFVLELYQGSTGVILPVDNWVYGTAGLILLVIVPYQLYGASQSALGMGYAIGHGMKQRYRSYRSEPSGSNGIERQNTRVRPYRPKQNKYPKERILNDLDDDQS